ncbi:MAG: heavy metal translocating P-type ATPase, partial [bacterium]
LVKRIVALVEEAQQTRTPFQTTIERFARHYTPIVIAIAGALAIMPPLLVGTLWKESIYRALTLLVISCPCALVLASPVSLSSAMVGASRLGALVKGGTHLESLAQIRTLAFDKTGTLTQGNLTITDIIPLNSCSKDEILMMASAVERHSEHPIAQALLRKNKEQGLPELIPSQFRSFPGKGAQAIVDSKQILVGNHSLIDEIGWCDPAIHKLLSSYPDHLGTMVIVAWDGKPRGIIALQDQYRQGAPEAIQRLKSLGISPLVMLSGDREMVASQMAKMLGIDKVYGDLLPHHKVEILKQLKLQYGRIAMVGDGVNDAPALSTSDVGIAVQHHRNKDRMDTALQTADIILIDGEITHLPDLIILSHRTRQTVLTNIIMSIGIKVLFIILGALGLSSLWLALVADEGVAIAVILNGIKLRKPKVVSS